MGGEEPVGQSSGDLTYPMLAKHKQQSCKSLLSAGTRNGERTTDFLLFTPGKHWLWSGTSHLPNQQQWPLEAIRATSASNKTAAVFSVTGAVLQGGYLLALLTLHWERASNKEAWCPLS